MAERASVVTLCLWWFGGLIVLNILLFWVPFVMIGFSPAFETKFVDAVFTWGIPLVWALAIFPIYKLFKIVKYDDNLGRFGAIALYTVLILIPFTTPLAFVLLFKKTLGEAPANDCPVCGSALTGKAGGKYQAVLFEAFANRHCRVCNTIWHPGCPKSVGVVCILAGLALFLFKYLMNLLDSMTSDRGMSPLASTLADFFASLPILYGLGVLLGTTGKMQILSKNGSDKNE